MLAPGIVACIPYMAASIARLISLEVGKRMIAAAG
jgi:hypothetical protein